MLSSGIARQGWTGRLAGLRTWGVRLAVMLVAAAVPGPAAALDVPATDTPDGYRVGVTNSYVWLTDTQTGRQLIVPNLSGIINDTPVTVQTEFVPQPGGFDLRFTYTNSTGDEQPLGRLVLGGLRFGQQVQARDFRHDGKVRIEDHGGQDYLGMNFFYPDDLYSPVIVMGDDQHTIGISFCYPVTDYDHQVHMVMRSPYRRPGDQGRNWEIEARMPGTIPAGQTRQYTMTVRAARAGEHWLKTLVPYRDYFRARYGGVQYTRDPRPVRGEIIAEPANFAPTNPRAFCWPTRRPDVHGWGPWAEALRAIPAEGYSRVMIWAASGLYETNRDNNFPFQVMTGLNEFPAAAATWGELGSVASPELELGVYWGFPQHVMRTWDQAGYELLDPDNPEHVDLGFAELDLITSVNATMVGLDAYVYMSPGKAHRWLNMMRQRAPQARFVLEPSNADIYHTVAATWQFVEQVDGPTVLADFLNPGHETWVAIQYNVLEAQLGRPMTQAEKMEVARRYASWGYTPLIFEQFTPTADMLAQESWNRTVPPQYRIATSTNSNFAPGTVSQNSDGTVTMVSAWVPEAPAAGDAPALGAAQAGPGDGGGTMIGGWVPGRERRAPARNAAVAGSRVPDLGAAALIPPGIARRASAPEPAARLPAARANHAAPSLRVPAPVVHRRAPPAVTDQMRDVLFPGAALASALEIAGAPTARPPGSAAAFFDPGKVAEAIARARGHQPRALANVPTP